MNSNGAIWLPKNVSVQVGSNSFESLRATIRSALRRAGFDVSDLSIGPGPRRSTRVSITGAIDYPGFVNHRKGFTLADVARLVRPSPGADLEAIRLTDADGIVTIHQLDSNLRSPAGPVAIRPGDEIFFPLLETAPDITVFGEVESPGKIDFYPGLTALRAVGLAGGLTGNSKSNKIEIVRKGEIIARANAELNYDVELKRGDQVRVPIIENPKYVFVAGAVNKAGRYAYRPGMRFTEALNLAQGVDPLTATNEAYLVRRTAGTLKRTKIDLDKMARRIEPNPILEPGDSIEIVPRVPKGKPPLR